MADMPETIINIVTLEGAKLTLTAGDTLVITCDRPLTNEQIALIKVNVTKSLPDGVMVMVLSNGLTVAAEVKA